MADSAENVEQKLSNEALPLPGLLSYTSPTQFVGDILTLPRGAEIHKQLGHACARGDLRTLTETLETNNISVNARFKDGFTLLMLAARNNQTRLVEFLLNQPGINVSARNDRTCFSALDLALKGRSFEKANYEMACALIKAGANINEVTNNETLLIDAWYESNQEAAMKLIILLGADIKISEDCCNSNALSGEWTEGVRHQIALSKQHLNEYLDNAKWLGIGIESVCFHFHPAKEASSKMAEFLVDGMPLARRAFNLGRVMMHKRLSAQFPTPAPTPTSIPRALLFMGDFEARMRNFENRMTNIGEELSWEKLKEEYNALHPGREEHGYGLGAMVVYKPSRVCK